MSNKFKTIFISVALTGFIFSSTTALADQGHIFPGITEPCQQLWLVNDPFNGVEDAEEAPFTRPNGQTVDVAGECIDVPVNLDEVKVLFNIDNATVGSDGVTPVALRHMALLGKVMQHRIAIGEMAPDDVAIVGIFHGSAMAQKRWPFNENMPAPVKKWINTIFALKNAGINIQLEVCGVTLKGMQLKGVRTSEGVLYDEKAVYANVDTDGMAPNTTGRIYVNQGAIGRMIELQQHDFVYLQEE